MCFSHIREQVNAVSQCAHMEHAPNDVGPCDVAGCVIGRPQNTSSWSGSEAMRYLADFLSFSYSSLSSAQRLRHQLAPARCFKVVPISTSTATEICRTTGSGPKPHVSKSPGSHHKR